MSTQAGRRNSLCLVIAISLLHPPFNHRRPSFSGRRRLIPGGGGAVEHSVPAEHHVGAATACFAGNILFLLSRSFTQTAVVRAQ